MTRNKILIVCPEIPYPCTSGGKIAMYNHIKQLALVNTFELHLVFLDVDGDRKNQIEHFSKMGINVYYFLRKIHKFGNGLNGKIAAVTGFLFSTFPRICYVRSNAEARNLIKQFSNKGIDAIIFEYLGSIGMFPARHNKACKWIYVAHNFESQIYQDKLNIGNKFSIKKIINYLELIKIKYWENKVINQSDDIVCIASNDKTNLNTIFKNKSFYLCPEHIEIKSQCWHNTHSKQILFIGSAGYFPNRDAILWLVNKFIPAVRCIDKEISLVIGGTRFEDVSTHVEVDIVENRINFLGFISDDQLKQLYINSGLFLCPIIYGSGIKMKVLEAISYCIPLACTEESMRGIDFIKEPFLINRNAEGEARKIVQLLNDPYRLENMSKNIGLNLKHATEQSFKFSDCLKTILKVNR